LNQEIISRYNRYLNGTCTAQEVALVMHELENGLHQQEWEYVVAQDAEEIQQSDFVIHSISSDRAEALHQRILQSIDAGNDAPKITRSIVLWKRVAVAAAVLTVLSFALYFFTQQTSISEHTAIHYHNDVKPGKAGATLTLANGKTILIAEALNGKIAEESGVRISKNASGQIVYEILNSKAPARGTNTLTTSRGEQTEVLLPDGSSVHLNAESSLQYPASFAHNAQRKVTLKGEGYFEVAKDSAHPFIVTAGNQKVTVLGTHFNINSYANEPGIKTTLLEGSIAVNTGTLNGILKPGQQALNVAGALKLKQVDTELAVAWTNNNFVFDMLDIEEIMRMLARWYDVEVIYTDGIPKGTFWGSVSRFDNISKVLIPLEATGNVHFEIHGRKIYVSP